jgi:glycosyltransferase involved in cell wall biosynthesis
MNARGFLMPQKEDAGIAPIEAMAAGIPVFWLAKGWLLEVNIDGVTGRFFPEETDESFEKWFVSFDQEVTTGKYDNFDSLIGQTKKFDVSHFREEFQRIIDREMNG